MSIINPYNGVITSGGPLSGALGLTDGNAGAPSLYFNNSPTTGIYRYAADTIGFAINGGFRAYLDAVSFQLSAGIGFYWNSRTVLLSPSDGVLTIANNAYTDFGRLQFGGTTNAFPSLKRSTTQLIVRLADDSGNAGLICNELITYSTVSMAGLPTVPGASGTLWVDTTGGLNIVKRVT